MKGLSSFSSLFQLSALVACALTVSVLFCASDAFAREVVYTGQEEVVCIRPGEPTQIKFPSLIQGGFRRKLSALSVIKRDNFLVVFAKPDLLPDGEGVIIHLNDNRTYAMRLTPSSDDCPRDSLVKIFDAREGDIEDEQQEIYAPDKFAPPSTTSGFQRQMILVAEFGKQKGILGYSRSQRYSGEVLVHDGAVKVTLDEMFIGSKLWGYVMTVENLLDSNQRLNPATFRMDGTKAITAERWELAPRPLTAEQDLSGEHKARIYVVTRAKDRL